MPATADTSSIRRSAGKYMVFALMVTAATVVFPAKSSAVVFYNDYWLQSTSASGTTSRVLVPVCIDSTRSSTTQKNGRAPLSKYVANPSLSTMVGQLRDALRESWEAYSGVRFVGWEDCPNKYALPGYRSSATSPRVELTIHPNAENESGFAAASFKANPPKSAVTSIKPWGSGGEPDDCIEYNWGTTFWEYSFECVREFGAHELGHTIGFLHEWRHPRTEQACRDDVRKDKPGETVLVAGQWSSTFQQNRFYVPNQMPDKSSLMTYRKACADVTGRRFGSRSLSPNDQNYVKIIYPPVPVATYDVGVVPGVNSSCLPGAEVVIRLDNEDNDNANRREGIIGKIKSDDNTRLTFCKVEGTRFGPVAQYSRPEGDYAVLKLGTSCPPGSKEFSRRQDDEDKHNENWMAGEVGPTRQDGSSTSLQWCLFESAQYGLQSLPVFDAPRDYSVVASPELNVLNRGGAGSIFMDDEDQNNINALYLGSSPRERVQRLIGVGRNTSIKFVSVLPRRWCFPYC